MNIWDRDSLPVTPSPRRSSVGADIRDENHVLKGVWVLKYEAVDIMLGLMFHFLELPHHMVIYAVFLSNSFLEART